MNTLLAVLPDSVLALVIALIGLGVVVGVISGRRAGSLVGGIIVLLLLGPFVSSLLSALPLPIVLILMLGFLASLLRGFANLIIGRRAADEMVGSLAADVVRFAARSAFGLFTLPFRIVGWAFRRQ